MSESNSHEYSRWQFANRSTAAFAAAALILSACSSETRETPVLASGTSLAPVSTELEDPISPAPESTVTELSSPDVACSFRPVSPESAFNSSNMGSIDTHLSVLMTAHDRTQQVRVRDYAHATAILTNILRDPVYSLAIADANSTIKSGGLVTAEQLLAGNYASRLEYCQPNFLTVQHASRQLDQFNTLFDDLLLNMAPQTGRQMSERAKEAYELARQSAENLRDRYGSS